MDQSCCCCLGRPRCNPTLTSFYHLSASRRWRHHRQAKTRFRNLIHSDLMRFSNTSHWGDWHYSVCQRNRTKGWVWIKRLTYFFIRRHFRIGVTLRLQKWWKSSSSKADPNDKTGLVNLYRGLINWFCNFPIIFQLGQLKIAMSQRKKKQKGSSNSIIVIKAFLVIREGIQISILLGTPMYCYPKFETNLCGVVAEPIVAQPRISLLFCRSFMRQW